MKSNATATELVWETARQSLVELLEGGTVRISDAVGVVLADVFLNGTASTPAIAAGVASRCRFCTAGGDVVLRGLVGKPGSGAPLEMNRVELRVGDPVTVESFNLGWAD